MKTIVLNHILPPNGNTYSVTIINIKQIVSYSGTNINNSDTFSINNPGSTSIGGIVAFKSNVTSIKIFEGINTLSNLKKIPYDIGKVEKKVMIFSNPKKTKTFL